MDSLSFINFLHKNGGEHLKGKIYTECEFSTIIGLFEFAHQRPIFFSAMNVTLACRTLINLHNNKLSYFN